VIAHPLDQRRERPLGPVLRGGVFADQERGGTATKVTAASELGRRLAAGCVPAPGGPVIAMTMLQ